MSKYQLVIFDWDGTVMDSIDRIVSSMQTAASMADKPVPSAEAVKNIIGLSLPVAIKKLFPQSSDVERNQIQDSYSEQYISGNSTPTPMFHGAVDLFEALLAAGIKLAVATGKSRAGLERVWLQSNCQHYFISSRCGSEVNSKPAPQMLTEILSETGCTADEAVMIGDTSIDMEMANNAGMDCIGVTMGVHGREVLSQYSPKVIVNSLCELRSYLLD